MAITDKNKKEILNRAYPVGCYYFSNTNNSPAGWVGGSWTQVSGGFLKPTTSGTGTGGSSSTTISAFAPSHSHSVGSHTHTIGSHSHTLSTSHSHTIGSHSHSGASNSHKHGFNGANSPPRDPSGMNEGNVNHFIQRHTGSYHKVSGTSTSGSTLGTLSTVATPSKTQGSNYASSTGDKASSLDSKTIYTDYEGSGSSQSIDIMPPYIACYCWRRDS